MARGQQGGSRKDGPGGTVVAQCAVRRVVKAHLPPGPCGYPCLRGPLSWARACCTRGFLETQSRSIALRVEEVNWAAWEQTLPTVCEEPSGPAVPGE